MSDFDQLFDAARRGNVDKVKEILERGKCTVKCTDSIGWTPLHWACLRGHLGLVKVLVSEFKADMTITVNSGLNVYNGTPLMLAARYGHGNVVHALLSDYKCPVNIKGQYGYTALHYSCMYGHVDTMRTLVKHKADFNARTDTDSSSCIKCTMHIPAYKKRDKARKDRGAREDYGDTPLTLAARHGNGNVVYALLSDYQCLVDAKGQDGYTALHFFCRYGHVDMVMTLVKHKANINARTDSGDIPLTLAARHGHSNVVHALLSDSQCPVDAKSQNGYTALHCSSIYGHVDTVRTLVKHKADVNFRTFSGDTPLTLAARHGHDNVIRVLFGSQSRAKYCQNANDHTPLTLAAIHGHSDVVDVLLSGYQCSVNAKGQNGFTALHYSCKYGHAGIVRTLVKHKADVNAKTDGGNTPYQLAIKHRHDNVVNELACDSLCPYTCTALCCSSILYKGDVRTVRTDTSLMEAARHGHDNIVHALLSNSGCQVNIKGQDGYTALHYSCRYGHIDIMRTLVKHKADVNAITDSGDTSLMLAARHGHDNIVHALLSNSGCQVNIKGQDGYTALHYSCRYGHIDIMRTLVKHKADVNAITDSGDTSLMLAARHGHDNIVDALLSNSGCQVNAKSQDHYTALHYSCRYGHVDIVRTLYSQV